MPLSPPVTRLLTALCFSAAAAAAVPPHQAGLDSALEQIAAQHYASAAQGLEELLRQYPAEPALLYHRLTVLQTMLLDYESYPIHGRAFLETADSVIAALATFRALSNRALPALGHGPPYNVEGYVYV